MATSTHSYSFNSTSDLEAFIPDNPAPGDVAYVIETDTAYVLVGNDDGIPVAGFGGISWIENTVNSTQTPAPDAVPQSDGEGQLASGWMPPSLEGNVRYVSPDGDDNNLGDSWERPLQFLKTAWEQLYALGDGLRGGTIYVADGTYVSADQRGLHVGWGYCAAPYSVIQMPVRVIGVSGTDGSSFAYTAPARVYGGARYPSYDQDDPGLWLHDNVSHPMTFENVRFGTSGVNKPIRVGWDYAVRDVETGEIVKPNVTAADRADGSTALTLEPYDFTITSFSRASDVLTIGIGLAALQNSPILAGMSVYVDFEHEDFTPGWFTVTGLATLTSFQVASTGDDIPLDEGENLGTASSTCLQPLDYLTLYSTNAEFPSSQYRVTAIDDDEVTVADYYGYSPRSATASEVDIGTYAAQDRYYHQIAKLSMSNVAGTPVTVGGERFVQGPGLDIATCFFVEFENMYVDGFNIEEVDGEFGCRDPERRASILFDGGGSTGGFGGTLTGHVSSIGAVRLHGPVGVANVVISDVLTDTPIVGTLPMPAVELLGIGSTHSITLNNINLADATVPTPTILVNDDAPWDATTINGVGGYVQGPCNIVGPPLPYLQASVPPPNQSSQTGWYGEERIVAGKHMGAARNVALGTTPISSQGISNDPSDWQSTVGLTVTEGVRDPFGGSNATRLYNPTGSPISAQVFAQHVGGASANGDIYLAAMWARGYANTPNVLNLGVAYDVNTYLEAHTGMPRKQGYYGEWASLACGGKLTGSPSGTDSGCLISINVPAGKTLDVYLPQLYVINAANATDISDAELAEIITNLVPTPAWVQPYQTGTGPNVKVIAHGGVGTGLAYVEGVGVGQVTIDGSFTPKKYEPVYDADGAVKGFVELLDGSINV